MGDESEAAHPDGILANKSQHKTERKENTFVLRLRVHVSDKKGNETKKMTGMTGTSTSSCLSGSLPSLTPLSSWQTFKKAENINLGQAGGKIIW